MSERLRRWSWLISWPAATSEERLDLFTRPNASEDAIKGCDLSFVQSVRVPCHPRKVANGHPRSGWRRMPQIPAYQEYSPPGGKSLMESVTVRRLMNFTLLYPNWRGTRIRSGPPKLTGSSPPFIP
jgi:hypothetical protein